MFGEKVAVYGHIECPYCMSWYRYRYDLAAEEIKENHIVRITCPHCEEDGIFRRILALPREHLTFKPIE